MSFLTIKIKDMRPTTGCGKTVAFFSIEFPGEMTVHECKLIDGVNGLFAAMFSKEYTQGGVKKYKPINKLERDLQERVNGLAIAEYRRVSGPQELEESDIPW